MLDILGWVGGICFAISAIPQAYKTYQQKHADGLAWAFLLLWAIGEVCTLIYIFPIGKLPLLVNYIVNLACLLVIIWYKVKSQFNN